MHSMWGRFTSEQTIVVGSARLSYFDNCLSFGCMATKQVTRNVALTPRLDRFIQARVNSGQYQSASEVVREGLRLLQEREQERTESLSRLREDIEIGWQQSSRGQTVNGPAVFAEIPEMSRRRRKAMGRSK